MGLVSHIVHSFLWLVSSLLYAKSFIFSSIFQLAQRVIYVFLYYSTFYIAGTVSTFLYSFSGAVLSYIGMMLVKSLGPKRVSIIGISATGGFMHNVGQLVTASLIAQSWTVMLYLPVLSFLGILSGIAIGVCANYLFMHVRTLQRFQMERDRQTQQNWASQLLGKDLI